MLRKLLALIMMPLVKKCFEDLVEKLAERNIDEVNTKSEKKVSSKPINKNASSHVEVQHQEEITAKLEKNSNISRDRW
ncbi:MAG: hypothetical protein U0X86_000707 [Wolbachia endosymbiont of Xenopsylla cheopis]